ncbi:MULTISPECIES: adenosylcobinamide-GDP ribazoletransferase [Desulfococcus]|uniref:Adenosylcobinamide-GDP ribazoletransferase n=1 Tax=Desulfococcus multivorans DSM 2059 TaxID=1121405 RepID=S7TXY8_DESML|nr:adenosylcobinamide-GDP ribazoletransferase [Desulfococcus multivorans]EPR41981.1 Cobalamin synthase [Desulfococcus multivorans DSM 2059]MDX9819909.1 adenosylcobinamide-GDP ribazoletransferase [Desulfococcus multivorans]SKA10703.1 cobalamin-5'-phosphate synthase [Desulfococcus multivorans DSM 2059]
MKNLISAIQFITRLPVGRPGTFEPVGMIPFFPIVGLLIGALLAAFDHAASQLWSRNMTAILDGVFLIWITGAFHIDGLGDTADGLYGNRPRDKALRIMKDSRIGAMALVTVISALAVKWGAIADLDRHRALFLLIIPAYARGSMLFGFRFLSYGRPDGGTGHALFRKPLTFGDFWGLSIPIGLSALAGFQGLAVTVVFIAVVVAVLQFYRRRMGCITGDMLGAMTEIMEAALFAAAAAGGAL